MGNTDIKPDGSNIIELEIDCNDCNGTGIHIDPTEKRAGIGRNCLMCKGTGKRVIKVNLFAGRKLRHDIETIEIRADRWSEEPERAISYEEFLAENPTEHGQVHSYRILQERLTKLLETEKKSLRNELQRLVPGTLLDFVEKNKFISSIVERGDTHGHYYEEDSSEYGFKNFRDLSKKFRVLKIVWAEHITIVSGRHGTRYYYTITAH